MDQGLEEPLPPYVTKNGSTGIRNTAMSPTYIRAVHVLVDSCRAILDTVISIADSQLRCSPTVIFARALYALTSLVMLEKALHRPQSVLRSILDEEALGIPTFVSSLIGKLTSAAGDLNYRAPSVILGVVRKIVAQNHGGEIDPKDTTRDIEPGSAIAISQEQDFSHRIDPGLQNFPPLAPQQELFTWKSIPISTGFEGQELSDTTLLSEFDAMIYPDFAIGIDGVPSFPNWEQTPFGGDWL